MSGLWREAAIALYMAGSWEAADALCEHIEGGDGQPCAPDDPECEPCEQRAALALFERAEKVADA